MRFVVSGVPVALLVVFAGCIDDSAVPVAPPVPEGVVTDVDPETGMTRHLITQRVRFDPDDVAATESFTGSFAPNQAWEPHGNLLATAGANQGSLHQYEVSAMVPKDVPTRVSASVAYETSQGAIWVWIQMRNEDIWTMDFDFQGTGTTGLSLMAVRTTDDPIFVNVMYGELEPAAQVDYTLTVDVLAEPWCVQPGVPVTVPVPKDAVALEISWEEGSGGPVYLWDPKDQLVGVLEPEGGVINHTFDLGERGGDYVILVPEHVPMATVLVYSMQNPEVTPKPLRFGLLGQDIQATDPERFGHLEEGSFSVDVPRAPIQVGMFVAVDHFTKGVMIEMSSPEKVLVHSSFQGPNGLPFVDVNPESSNFFWFVTPMGAPGLVAGTYTGHFASDANSEGETGMFIVHYSR